MNRLSSLHWISVGTLLFVIAGSAQPAIPQAAQEPAAGIFDHLPFRSIGPAAMGGRIDDLAVLETHPATFYVAAATGGLWKTTSNGTVWESVFDRQDVVSLGAVAIPKDSASLVWVGTGENNNRQSSSWGSGVYKSTDAGKTWKNMGLTESRHVGRILIDPVDHDVVYVASMGHLWGPNKERGVFKTVDGGLTWTQSLFVDDNSGATDLAMDPTNNKVLYAAIYQRQRSAWGFNGGGPGSGLYKSTDAGRTWARLTDGIPAGPLGRIGIDIYRRDPRIVYALIQQEPDGGLYRSDDAGSHWTKVSNTNPRPMYFSQVRIDPNDSHRVYVLGTRDMVSDDGGKTFNEIRVSYVRPGGERPRDDMDAHAMWIDPNDSAHFIVGADAGITISYDRGATLDYLDNLPIAQFYHVGYDLDTPYHVYGGLQDNDVWAGPSATRNRWGIRNSDWFTFVIGDGMVAFADPHDSRTLYGESQDGSVARVDRDTNERKTIKPQPRRGEPPLRFAWNAPLLLSPHDSNTVLMGANKVFRSPDRGQSWEAISPDLTTGVDRDSLSLMGFTGKQITLSKNDGVTAYPALVALAESPKKAGVYYAGADDGRVHVSKDGGKTWLNITSKFPNLAENASAGTLVPSAFDEATAYATFNNHRADDYTPYVYVTSDYGNKWTSLASTLPKGQTVNCLTEDPKNPNVLYLGTEFGLFVSLDKGQHWMRLKNNLPTVPIDEITIQPRDNDMLLATHGRSIWILDDLTPIQQAAEAMKATSYLFGIRSAFEFNPSNEYASFAGDRRFWGQNPEFGAAVTFYIKDAPKEVRLTVRDSGGAVVREISGDDLKNARQSGINRIYWDLRHQPVETPRRAGAAPGGPGGASPGPFVLPGEYRVTLTVDGRDLGSSPVRVQGDPLIRISDADRKTQHDTALTLSELQRSMNEAAAAVVSANEQIRAVQEVLKLVTNPPPAATSAADALAKRLSGLARQFGGGQQGGGDGEGNAGPQPMRNQVTALKGQIMTSTSLPTAQQIQQARDNREEIGKLIDELNDILTNAMPALFKTLADNNILTGRMKLVAPVKLSPAAG